MKLSKKTPELRTLGKDMKDCWFDRDERRATIEDYYSINNLFDLKKLIPFATIGISFTASQFAQHNFGVDINLPAAGLGITGTIYFAIRAINLQDYMNKISETASNLRIGKYLIGIDDLVEQSPFRGLI